MSLLDEIQEICDKHRSARGKYKSKEQILYDAENVLRAFKVHARINENVDTWAGQVLKAWEELGIHPHNIKKDGVCITNPVPRMWKTLSYYRKAYTKLSASR